MKKILKRFLGIFISLALVFSLMPCMSMTVYAVDPYSSLVNTTNVITFDSKQWYLIDYDSSDGTVTLLSKECVAASKYNNSDSYVEYESSTVKGVVDDWYSREITAAAKKAVVDNKMFLLSTEEAKTLSGDVRICPLAGGVTYNRWWLRSRANDYNNAVFVSGEDGTVAEGGFPVNWTFGVRPALKLDLSAVHFSSASKEFTLNPYASLVNTTTPVKFNGIDWYIIDDNSTAVNSGTVTLLAKDPIAASKFHDNSNAYSGSTVEGYLDELTNTGGPFESVASAIVPTDLSEISVTGAKLWLLSTEEAYKLREDVRKCSKADGADANFWWLRSAGEASNEVAYVWADFGEIRDEGVIVDEKCGIRPALNLNLSAVYFASDTNTFTLNPYASLVNTTTVVKFDNKDWYLIEDNSTAIDDGTVTLLSKECVGASQFNPQNGGNTYSGSNVETAVNNYYTSSISADAKEAVSGSEMFLLTTEQANAITNTNVLKCPKAEGAGAQYWWLRSPGSNVSYGSSAAIVNGEHGIVYGSGSPVYGWGGVRPALNLDLSEVTFTSVTLSGGANATPSVDNTTQYFFNVGTTPNNMTVTYTASNGYQFPESSDYYKKTNGITVARTNATTVTVSGTPTAVVSITVPDAVAIPATAPNITAQPSGAALTSGYATGATLTVEATAATDTTYDALTYQWYSNTSAVNTGGTPIPNATGASYTFPTGKSEGNYYYYCVVTATRTDNSATKATTSNVATVTVNKATPPTPPKPNPLSSTPTPTKPTAYVKTAPVANTLTYSEQQQELVTAGESTGGEMLYTLGNSKSSMPTSGWSTSIPTATDVGTYFVWYKAKGDSYHRDSSPKCVTVTIGKVPSTVTTVPTVKTLLYSGKSQALVTAGEVAGGKMKYAVGTDSTTAPKTGWSTEIPKVTDAGTYYIWYKVVGDNDHEDSEPSYAGAATIIENHSDNELAIDEEKGIATVKDDVSGGTTEVPLYVITEGLTYRMYDSNRGEHFYTKDPDEVESLVQLGWRHESDSDFTVVSATEEDAAPVYRLYNPNCGGMHFYTIDAEEAKYLKSIGWNYEGISHFVYKATSTKGTPQHRLYNPNSPSAEHLWTSDEAEVNMLIEAGWIYEGVCWRVA